MLPDDCDQAGVTIARGVVQSVRGCDTTDHSVWKGVEYGPAGAYSAIWAQGSSANGKSYVS